ncbi:hypothetical protein ACLB2K_005694 [Fragaria x ananassa]
MGSLTSSPRRTRPKSPRFGVRSATLTVAFNSLNPTRVVLTHLHREDHAEERKKSDRCRRLSLPESAEKVGLGTWIVKVRHEREGKEKEMVSGNEMETLNFSYLT